MFKYSWCLLLLVMLASCKGKSIIPDAGEGDNTNSVPPPPAPYTGPVKYCFEKHGNDNSEQPVTMSLVIDNDIISGYINLQQYDSSNIQAQLEGMMLGNVMKLTQTYTYRDTTHREEVIYKFEGEKLFKKTGKLALKDSILILDDPLHARFILAMDKVPCR